MLSNGGVLNVINMLQVDNDKYGVTTQTKRISKENLVKSRTNNANEAGMLKYSIDVNPRGANISKGDTIDLEDIITFGSIANVESKKDEILGLLANSDSTQIKDVTTSITSPSDIELGLVSIKVYDADTNEELGKDDYSYSFSKPESKDKTYTFVMDSNNDIDSSPKGIAVTDFGSLVPGSDATIEINVTQDPTAQPLTNLTNVNLELTNTTTGNSKKILDSATIEKNAEGKYIASFKVPSDINDYNKLYLVTYEWRAASLDSAIINGKYSHSDYAGKLTMKLPDSRHLRVTYEYQGLYKGNDRKVIVEALNNVSNKNGIVQDESGNNSYFKVKDDSSSISYTTQPVTLDKVSVHDYSVRINASFKLYKWDSTNRVWQVATSIVEKYKKVGGVETSSGVNEVGKHKEPNKQYNDRGAEILDNGWETVNIGPDGKETNKAAEIITKGDKYQINLESGTMYKIVETMTDSPYVLLNKPRYVTYYEPPKESVVQDVALNDGITNSDYYDLVGSKASVFVQNSKKVKVKIDKNWGDGAENHVGDSATFALYRSHTKDDVKPDDAVKIGDSVKITNSNEWTYVFDGTQANSKWPDKTPESNGYLLDGDDEGNPWYYYVVEESSEISNHLVNYNVYYEGNATQEDEGDYALVEIKDNSIILDKNGKTITSIKFKMYRSLTKPTEMTYDEDGIPNNSELYQEGADASGEYSINSDDGWIKIFDSLEDIDESGEKYYYYPVESKIEGYERSEITGSESNGMITITNTSVKGNSYVLPMTGGSGYYMAMIAGFAMCAVSSVLLYRKKNKEI